MRYQPSSSLLLLLTVLLRLSEMCQAFSSSAERIRQHYPTHLYQQENDKEEAVLTDLDARVLQEMLQDSNKLDLQETENMKSLLERGIKAKERADDATTTTTTTTAQEESPFQSELLQKLGSTKLWKAFERKAEDWVESAKIYVSNRVERDAKLIAGLGLFAFERAMQDVARALPAQSTWKPKKQFLLSNVTQAQEMQSQKDKIRQEMSTPFDEIKAVGRQLKDIFRQTTTNDNDENVVGVAPPSSKTNPFDRNLKSAAASSKYAVNDKERFQKAYQRKQETTLKREKENVVQSSARIANNVADKAYQIKREVQAETNQPGYKTQAIRAQTMETSRRLASGAKRILGGAKNLAAAALEASRQEDKAKAFKLPEKSKFVEPPPSTAAQFVDEALAGAAAAIEDDTTPWSFTNFGATTSSIPSLELLELQDVLETEMEGLVYRLTECIQNPQGTWLNPDLLAGQDFVSFPDDQLESVVVSMVQAQMMLQDPLENEQDMISTLQLVQSSIDEMCGICLQVGSRPIADYLQQTLVYGGSKTNGQIPVLLKLDEYQLQLETLHAKQQERQDSVVAPQAAAGTAAAAGGTSTPWFVDDNDQTSEAVQETRPWYVEDDDEDDVTVDAFSWESPARRPTSSREMDLDEVEVMDTTTYNGSVRMAPVESQIQEVEILDAVPTTMRSSFMEPPSTINGSSKKQADTESVTMRQVMAEIVTDDDFEVAMGQAKTVDEGIQGDNYEEEDEDGEPNPVAMAALRALDVVLLAGEKTAAVLPSLINFGGTVTDRVSNVKGDGLGSQGWDIIVSAKRGEKKY